MSKKFTKTEINLIDNIKINMGLLRISQKHLASDIKVSETLISRFLKQQDGLSFNTIESICSRLNIRCISIDFSEHTNITNKINSIITNNREDIPVITLTEISKLKRKDFIRFIENSKSNEIIVLKKKYK